MASSGMIQIRAPSIGRGVRRIIEDEDEGEEDLSLHSDEDIPSSPSSDEMSEDAPFDSTIRIAPLEASRLTKRQRMATTGGPVSDQVTVIGRHNKGLPL